MKVVLQGVGALTEDQLVLGAGGVLEGVVRLQ